MHLQDFSVGWLLLHWSATSSVHSVGPTTTLKLHDNSVKSALSHSTLISDELMMGELYTKVCMLWGMKREKDGKRRRKKNEDG